MNINNYTLISILPTIGEVFAKIKYEQLLILSDMKNMFCSKQFGLRSKRSTVDAFAGKKQTKQGSTDVFTCNLLDLRRHLVALVMNIYVLNRKKKWFQRKLIKVVWIMFKRKTSVCSDKGCNSGFLVPAGRSTAGLNSWASNFLNIHQWSSRCLWNSWHIFVCWRHESYLS